MLNCDVQNARLIVNRMKIGRAIFIIVFCGVTALALCLSGCATRPDGLNDSDYAGPEIYDPRADGEQQLASALAEAKVQHKRVLLNLGANWCSDSQSMFRLIRNDPRIARELNEHYVLAMVDVNKRTGFDRNSPLVTLLGDPLGRGIPGLLVLDSDGTVLNADPRERLADIDHKRPKKVLRYLQKWSGNVLPAGRR